MKIKLCTFNICHGENLDESINIKNQGLFLKQLELDFCLLQECQVYGPRVHEENELLEISNYSSLEYSVLGTNNTNQVYGGGYYGNAILSKYPIKYSINYLNSKKENENEQRGILHSKIELQNKTINLFSVHYPTNLEERIISTKELTKILEKVPSDEIIIVGGDFNLGIEKIGNHEYIYNQKDKYEEIQLLERILNKINNNESTWFSKKGTGCIDTIFYSKNIKLIRFETIKNNYSDHSAITLELEI